MDTNIKTINGYLRRLSEPEIVAFQRIERLVSARAPQAELVISYGMPTFKLGGKVVLHFGAFKDHLSIFPGASPIAELADQLAAYKTAKGTIQFAVDSPLPDDLLDSIIDLCLKRARSSK